MLGDVIGAVLVAKCLSWQPHIQPGVEQLGDIVEEVVGDKDDIEVGVAVIGGAGIAVGEEVADVVVVGSLHPNQPGV